MVRRERPGPPAATPAILLAVVALVVLLAGCSGSSSDAGSDDPEVTVPTTADPAVVDQDDRCASAAALLFRSVASWAAADGAAPAAAITLEQTISFLQDLERWATGEAADDVAAVLAGARAVDEDPSADPGSEARAALDRLIPWAAGECPPSRPIWSCNTPATFTPVGVPIDAGDGSGEEADGPAASPEEAVADVDAGGTRTVVEASDDRVVFAWVGEDRLVSRAEVVARADDGWVAATWQCRM